MARTVRLIAAIAVAGALVFAGGFVMFARTVAAYAPAPVPQADAIVVLTGGELRLVAGARLLAEKRGRRLLISGVNRQTTREDLRRLSGLPDGLFSCCVDIDFAEHTTANADETRAWATARRFARLIVVTSSYHMPRSLIELERVMPGVVLVPYPVVSNRVQAGHWWRDAHTARVLLSEYLKFLPSAARYGVARIWRWEHSAHAAGAATHTAAR